MAKMFSGCKNFNQDLAGWNVREVRNMSGMFSGCEKFNQDLAGWNVSEVRNMAEMFSGCKNFDQPFFSWGYRVNKVTNMAKMFSGCKTFNQDLIGWGVSEVTNMTQMFSGCKNFNGYLDGWDVSGVTDMSFMFYGCKKFDQDLTSWNVQDRINKTGIFIDCPITITQVPENLKDEIVSQDLYDPTIKKRLKKFVKKTKKTQQILQWMGSKFIQKLFYTYLLTKYDSRCVITTNTRDIILILDDEDDDEDDYFDTIANDLYECINRNTETIIIPITLQFKDGAHANVLIYRKNNNTIEHFEPHGSKMSIQNGDYYHSLTKDLLETIIDKLNEKLQGHEPPLNQVTFVSSEQVCPSGIGLQVLDNEIKNTILANGKEETKGYCLAWSMFFTELALLNPKFTSQQLLTQILGYSKKDPNFIKNLIRGYVLNISEILETYFSSFFGERANLQHIYKSFNDDRTIPTYTRILNKFVDIELLRLNDKSDNETMMQTIQDEIDSIENNILLIQSSEDKDTNENNEALEKMKNRLIELNEEKEYLKKIETFEQKAKQSAKIARTEFESSVAEESDSDDDDDDDDDRVDDDSNDDLEDRDDDDDNDDDDDSDYDSDYPPEKSYIINTQKSDELKLPFPIPNTGGYITKKNITKKKSVLQKKYSRRKLRNLNKRRYITKKNNRK
jgi:surface protein